jgi:trimeric autotransporter adhesin
MCFVVMMVCIQIGTNVFESSAQNCSECESNCSGGASANGDCSFAAVEGATADGDYSAAIGYKNSALGPHSLVFGNVIQTTSGSQQNMTIGMGIISSNILLSNSFSNSIMIGMNSTLPTIFVEGSSGAGTWGNVGIGTTASIGLLHLREEAGASNELVLEKYDNTLARLRFQQGTSFLGHLTMDDAEDMLMTNRTNNRNIIFGINQSNTQVEAMRIEGTSGNVGIGLASPAFLLDVYGAANLRIAHRYHIGGLQALGLPGSDNVAVGHQTGTAITSGSRNIMAGTRAGQSITTGQYNALIGYEAGMGITTGHSNAVLGHEAGHSLTTGSNNCFIGFRAGRDITDGTNNIAMGNQAGLGLTSGGYNIMIGRESGLSSSASTATYNTFIGWQAGRGNVSGTSNVFIGSRSGYSADADYNVFIGYLAGFGVTSGSRNLYLGFEAGYDATTASHNMFMGMRAGRLTTTGDFNAFLGYQAGYNNTTGEKNTCIGYLANLGSGGLTNSTAIGANTTATQSNTVILGNGANVGIGTTAPAYLLAVNGDAAKTGGGVWQNISDMNLKQDIEEFTDGLDVLLQFQPKRYKYNGTYQLSPERTYVGVVAQDVAEVAPYMVNTVTLTDTATGDSNDFLSYDGTALTYIIVNAFKELEQRVSAHDQLAEQVEQLNQQVTLLQQSLAECCNSPAHRLNGEDSDLSPAVPLRSFGEYVILNTDPNPFSDHTRISFSVPEGTAKAEILLTDPSGGLVNRFELRERGTGEVTLYGSSISSGMYVCSLVLDGRIAASRMLIKN